MLSPKLHFEVPFLPDQDYISFLAANQDHLSSVYLSLHTEAASDARVGIPAHPLSDIIDLLHQLPRVSKYVLLNSRFHAPVDTLDPGRLDAVLARLQELLHAGCVQGIVYVDHYLLQALSDRAPATCARLEAVPGVNSLLDSMTRIAHYLEFTAQTAFKPPSKLVLDRSLNRNLTRLDQISRECRRLWPDMRLGLLANEGCLPQCPFKLTHDSTIALGRMDPSQEQTWTMNTTLGCARAFQRDPSLVLRSPFIRPEDVDAYAHLVQEIKLCGRTRGPRIMQKVIRLYLDRSYQGNLLELLDTQELLADKLYAANEELPPDFGHRTKDCGLACYRCSYCREVASEHVQDLGLHIKPMWA